MSLDLLDQDLLHFHGSNVLSTLHSLIELFTLSVRFNSFVVEANRLVDFGGTFVLLNSKKSLAKGLSNFINSILCIGHSQVEAVVPDFFKLISILEMLLCNLEVSTDSLLVVTGVFPVFGGLENLLS